MKPLSDLQRQHEIEYFYYREARLLDGRQFRQWMELLAPGVEVLMPSRNRAPMDVQLNSQQDALSVAHELSHGPDGVPLRRDDMLALTLRANRPSSPASAADNPPARTVRHVSNIEVYPLEKNHFRVFNNVLMSYSRHSADNCQLSFQREDELKRIGRDYRLYRRKIILDWNLVTAPTVAMLL